jgi:acetolactate synthase I/II/III large subunit
MTVSHLLVRFLKDADVRYIFGVSGHSIFDLTDAIYVEPDIDFVSAQIELSAAYMANAYSRATRRLGVCLASAGAGATNLVTGVAQAYKESCPVLAISSDVDSKLSGKGASSWHEVPQEELFRPITKRSLTLHRPSAVLDLLSEALQEATTPRTGPVYIGIPRDFQTEEIDVPSPPWTVPATASAAPDAGLIRRAAEELAAASAPTIILGGGVHWADAADEARQLAERLQAPFGTSPSHKGLISETHPLALGVLGFGAFPFSNAACQESDVVLAVGTTLSEALTLGYGDRVIPGGAKLIHVDLDPSEIGKSYQPLIGIVGDAKQVLADVLAQAPPRPNAAAAERARRIAGEKAAWDAELARRGSSTQGPINQWHMFHALSEAMPPDTVVVVEGGTGEAYQRLVGRAPVFGGGDFRPIGHGIATSIGVKHGFPTTPVACVSGDGSFMMEMQELATATRTGWPFVFLVVHNGAYGNMKRDQIRHYGGRVIGTELNVPDLCTLGSAFGAHVERIEAPSQLVDAIGTAFAADKTALLDVVCPIEGI